MHLLKRKFFKGQSTLEYVALLMIVIGAFFVFQKYILRGISGRWKQIGESMSSGRLYDKKMTVECRFDVWENTNLWFNAQCFDKTCGEADCLMSTRSKNSCATCIHSCLSDLGGIDVCNR